MIFKRLAVALTGLFVLSGLALGGAALPGPALAADSGWTQYSNPDLGVSVDFPGVPKVSSESGDDSGLTWTTTSAMVEQGEAAVFLLSVTQYGVATIPNAAAAMDGGIEGLLESAKATLVSRTDLTVDGNPAADVVAKVPGPNYLIRVRLVIRGNRLYQIMAIGDGVAPPETDRFIASVKFTP